MVEWVGAFPHYQWVAGMFSVGQIEAERDDPGPGAGPCLGRVPIRDLLLKFLLIITSFDENSRLKWKYSTRIT